MADKEVAIRINDIHKEFILPQSKNTSVKQVAVNIVRRNNKVTQKVLDGVSFDINKGDFFGIVGRNGSGKSTLLKLIAGVYYPTSGNIEVNGGLTPFIELGVGFNPELSGRDNVYLNGALLGFTRTEMNTMYDDIVEFAELGPFMDQKLKNYSSGMQVRLAFSIAIKAKNEILVFDEVLAVGDEAFQRKCLDVFERYKSEHQTVVLVTHDMSVVRRFCNKAALIGSGKVISVGDQRKVADYYSRLNQEAIDSEEEARNITANRKAGVVRNLNLILSDGVSRSQLKTGENIGVSFEIAAKDKAPRSVIVNLYKNSGEYIVGLRAPDEVARKSEITLTMAPRLGIGKYHFSVEAYDGKGNLLDDIYESESFTVNDSTIKDFGQWSGTVAVEHLWR